MLADPIRQAIAGVGVVITFAAYLPYMRSILCGQTRPHVFSWIVWAATTLLAGAASVAGGGGLGGWVIVASGCAAGTVAGLAWMKRGDFSITAADWLFLGAALAALPVWAVTRDPLWATAILTGVDLLGFAPSFRKAFHRPHEDRLVFHAVLGVRNILSMAALERVSLTTAMFPALVGTAGFLYVALVQVRRMQLARVASR